jgi:hypothetical protein
MRKVLLLILFFLGACGFEPLYKSHEAQNPQSFKLQVTGNNDHAQITFRFKKALEYQLRQITKKIDSPLIIKVNLGLEFGDIGFNQNASILRTQGRGAAQISIQENSVSKPFYENEIDLVSSYTVNESEEFSNLSAQNASRERIIQNLAVQVGREVIRALNQEYP